MRAILLAVLVSAIMFFSALSIAQAYTTNDNVDVTISLKKGWNMVSSHLSYWSNTHGILCGTKVKSTTCTGDPTSNFYVFNPLSQSYEIAYSATLRASTGDLETIQEVLNSRRPAFWAKVKEDCTITFTGVPKTAEKPGGFWVLYDGWNQFSNPYTEDVSWEDLKGTCKDIRSGPWEWDSEKQEYKKASTIEVNKGYFVKVNGACYLGTSEDLPPLPQ
jgi:hypothetical protein